ncbi:hypothetical protein [Hydrogenophaga sp.]|uniref:hypothetical protein n=1 Tax=Hydrogenophaga sp. TaxID=1904254 RepID=UPI002728D103|nr:hypothetical protein [Hydrogenophaga sp.]MDO8903986.1 hypothetical protein [Hydrogenophaga sp.]
MASITLLVGYMTKKGPVFIGQSLDGRFHPMWKNESLGSYHSVIAAIDDVAGGHTFSPSDGTDMDSLEISGDPGDWVPAKELL